jgi:hypothetical protein
MQDPTISRSNRLADATAVGTGRSAALALRPVLGAGVRYGVALDAAMPVQAQGCRVVAQLAADGIEDRAREVLDGLAWMQAPAHGTKPNTTSAARTETRGRQRRGPAGRTAWLHRDRPAGSTHLPAACDGTPPFPRPTPGPPRCSFRLLKGARRVRSALPLSIMRRDTLRWRAEDRPESRTSPRAGWWARFVRSGPMLARRSEMRREHERGTRPAAAVPANRPNPRGHEDSPSSGRPDSNRRPPAPKAGALPGCATPRPPEKVRGRGGRPLTLR